MPENSRMSAMGPIHFGPEYDQRKAQNLERGVQRLYDSMRRIERMLAGGDPDQVLTKTTVKDFTATWADASSGGIQAGDNVSLLTNDAGYATTTYVDTAIAAAIVAVGGPFQPLSSVLTAYAGGNTPSAFTLSIVDSVDDAAWRAAIGAGTSSAVGDDPSAQVGLAAVNGVALTFMRSDAAPALDQGITPVWTGLHIHDTTVQFRNVTRGGASGFEFTTAVSGTPADGVESVLAMWEDDLRLYGFRWKLDGTQPATGDLILYQHDNSAGGQEVLRFSRSEAQLQGADGSATNPFYGFSSDRDLGTYRLGADQLGINALTSVTHRANGTGTGFITYNLNATSTAGYSILDELQVAQVRFGYSNNTDRGFINCVVSADFTFQQASAVTLEYKSAGHWLARDNFEFQLGTGADLRLFHDGTNNFISYDNGYLSFRASGTELARMTTGASPQLLLVNSGASIPALAHITATTTGIFIQTSLIGFSISGTQQLRIDANSITSTVRHLASNGSAGSPTYGFSGDSNNGWYYVTTDTIAESTASTERRRINASGAWGLAGANYGTAGTQAIVSNGSAAAVTWQTVVMGTGTQTGLAGDKTWTGLHTFSGSGARIKIINPSGGGDPADYGYMEFDDGLWTYVRDNSAAINRFVYGAGPDGSVYFGNGIGWVTPLLEFTASEYNFYGGPMAIGPTGNTASVAGFMSKIQLEGDGNGGNHAAQSITRYSGDAVGPQLALAKSRNATYGSYTIVQDNDVLGSLMFAGDDGTDYATIGARIQALVDGTPAANTIPASLTFSTMTSGGTLTEWMRISPSGQLGFAGENYGAQGQILVLNSAGTPEWTTHNPTMHNRWSFNSSTSAADPGSRKFSLDNATLASVTNIYINDTTNDGSDASTVFGFLTTGDRIIIQQLDDAGRAALFDLSGAPTDNGGWWTIPVTVVGSGTLFTNNRLCGVVLSF